MVNNGGSALSSTATFASLGMQFHIVSAAIDRWAAGVSPPRLRGTLAVAPKWERRGGRDKEKELNK